MYGLDLMGSDSWGAEGEWGGEQSWGKLEYGNEQWGGYEGTGYLRSLATLAAAPILSVKKSFDALADRHYSPVDVPILDLVVTSKRTMGNNTKHKTKFIDNKCDWSMPLFFLFLKSYNSLKRILTIFSFFPQFLG